MIGMGTWDTPWEQATFPLSKRWFVEVLMGPFQVGQLVLLSRWTQIAVRVGESSATHVSHSGAFALDSAAGSRAPVSRVCLFPWTMDLPGLLWNKKFINCYVLLLTAFSFSWWSAASQTVSLFHSRGRGAVCAEHDQVVLPWIGSLILISVI